MQRYNKMQKTLDALNAVNLGNWDDEIGDDNMIIYNCICNVYIISSKKTDEFYEDGQHYKVVYVVECTDDDAKKNELLDTDKYPNIAKVGLGVKKIELLKENKYPFCYHHSNMFIVSFDRAWCDDIIITTKTQRRGTDFRKVNGWSMLGNVYEDYCCWVDQFVAFKEQDIIFGDFSDKVFCSSLDALEDFLKNFEVDEIQTDDVG